MLQCRHSLHQTVISLSNDFCRSNSRTSSYIFYLNDLPFLMWQADAKTGRFRDRVLKHGGTWRDIYGIDEKKVASMIREDKIDILVELTGHTANNKLGMMACRPAPIQVFLDAINVM